MRPVYVHYVVFAACSFTVVKRQFTIKEEYIQKEKICKQKNGSTCSKSTWLLINAQGGRPGE